MGLRAMMKPPSPVTVHLCMVIVHTGCTSWSYVSYHCVVYLCACEHRIACYHRMSHACRG